MDRIKYFSLAFVISIITFILYLSILNLIGLKDIHKQLKEQPIKYEVH